MCHKLGHDLVGQLGPSPLVLLHDPLHTDQLALQLTAKHPAFGVKVANLIQAPSVSSMKKRRYW